MTTPTAPDRDLTEREELARHIDGAIQITIRYRNEVGRVVSGGLMAADKALIVAVLTRPSQSDREVREALEPFAKIADLYDDREDDTFRLVADMDIDAIKLLTLGACRKARAALAQSDGRKP